MTSAVECHSQRQHKTVDSDRLTLEEDLEDASGLFVDEARDTLDTTTTGETADGRLGDALDVVAQDLAVTLGSSFAETARRE